VKVVASRWTQRITGYRLKLVAATFDSDSYKIASVRHAESVG